MRLLGVLGSWGVGLFIFRELGSTCNYLRGAGEQTHTFGDLESTAKSRGKKSGILGVQGLIYRDQGSTDPPTLLGPHQYMRILFLPFFLSLCKFKLHTKSKDLCKIRGQLKTKYKGTF